MTLAFRFKGTGGISEEIFNKSRYLFVAPIFEFPEEGFHCHTVESGHTFSLATLVGLFTFFISVRVDYAQ